MTEDNVRFGFRSRKIGEIGFFFRRNRTERFNGYAQKMVSNYIKQLLILVEIIRPT